MSLNRSNRFAGRRAAAGFTLVEVIIVALIISVLAAIAYPAYQDSVVRARRDAGKACIMEASQFMERFYTTNPNLTYAGGDTAWLAIGCVAGTDVTAHYNVTPVVTGPRAYNVTATPLLLQLARDTKCGILSMDSLGNKTESGTQTRDYCW